MKEKFIIFPLIFGCVSSLSFAADDTRILSCHSLKRGVGYTAEIKIVGGRVDEYTYVSMNKRGNDCNLSASRHDWDSEWSDEDNRTSHVVLYSNGKEVGKVLLVSTPPRYTIKLLTPLDRSMCAMGASIATSVTLTQNVSRCRLEN